MRRGQHESVSLLTGMIIAILILLALSFVSCSIAKQQAGVRSRINFDQVAAYLQQCQQLGQKGCYCPLLPLETLQRDESLHFGAFADGVYLDLQKEGQSKPLQRKKVSDKGLCTYAYASDKQQWVSTPVPTYTLDSSHRVTFAEGLVFMAYLDAAGNLCALQGFLEGGLKFTERGLDPRITSQLRSCSAPEKESFSTFYLQQRYTPDNPNPEEVMKSGQAFLQELQTTFSSLGKVYASKVEPSIYTSISYGTAGMSRPQYTKPQDTTQQTLALLWKDLSSSSQKKLLILSTLYTQTKERQEKDSITLYYLRDSATSKSLATFLQQRLMQLSGKSYLDKTLLSDSGTTAQQYLFQFWLDIQPLDDAAAKTKGILFFQPWFEKDYSQLSRDRSNLPAVFIDFVDHENSYALLDKHHYTLSQSLLLAVQDYLQQQPSKTENLFQP